MRSRSLAGVLTLVILAATLGCGAFKRWAYAGPGRDSWQRPEQVITALGLDGGARVADLGAGGGYFTFRLADAVGPGGLVYAVDVDEAMTGYLEQRAREEQRENVQALLAAYDDPGLPAEGVDLIFSCNTYHHIEERTPYFANARKYLGPGGRVAIVEYSESGWLGRLFGEHSTPPETIRSEMEAAGYRLETEHEFLPRQSFLVFAVEPRQ